MLDRKFIREHPEMVRQALLDRHYANDLDEILAKDAQRRDLIAMMENKQAYKNKVNETIAQQKKEGKDASQNVQAMRQVNEEIKSMTEAFNRLEEELQTSLSQLPNIPHSTVPRGADASANQEVRRWGKAPTFDFDPSPHWEIGERMDILNSEQAAKITGARFIVYRGAGARLERALIQFMLDIHTRENGYLEIFPPILVNQAAMFGTGQLPKMENDMFRTKEEDLFLIPTAEVPLVNLHRQEVLNVQQLPVKYVAYTPCFRREAGSYGKDTKGIVRQHQFNKVELVKIVHPDTSYIELESMVQNAESVLQRLGLHYRVVILCTGDMSFASSKSYDLEVWHAGSKRYWEVSSCSNCEDFQARRANIRFKDKSNKTLFCHTLNGSGVATSRLLPAILENYQMKDGSVKIPEVLVPYLEGKTTITPEGILA